MERNHPGPLVNELTSDEFGKRRDREVQGNTDEWPEYCKANFDLTSVVYIPKNTCPFFNHLLCILPEYLLLSSFVPTIDYKNIQHIKAQLSRS